MHAFDRPPEAGRILAANRSEESHFAGGLVLNAGEGSPRYSHDFDIFHEAEAEVARASDLDVGPGRRGDHPRRRHVAGDSLGGRVREWQGIARLDREGFHIADPSSYCPGVLAAGDFGTRGVGRQWCLGEGVLSPLPGLGFHGGTEPSAHALGYFLPALRACGAGLGTGLRGPGGVITSR